LTLVERERLSISLQDFANPQLIIPAHVQSGRPSDDFDVIFPSLEGRQTMTFANGGNRAIWIKSISYLVAISQLAETIWDKCSEVHTSSNTIFEYEGFKSFLIEPGKIVVQSLTIKRDKYGDANILLNKDDASNKRIYVCLEISAVTPENENFTITPVLFYTEGNVRDTQKYNAGEIDEMRATSKFLRGEPAFIVDQVGILGHRIWSKR
jgi:hypothetical protein